VAHHCLLRCFRVQWQHPGMVCHRSVDVMGTIIDDVWINFSLGSLSLRLSEGLSLFNGLGGEVMIMSRYRFTHLGDTVPILCKAFIVVVMKENMERVIER